MRGNALCRDGKMPCLDPPERRSQQHPARGGAMKLIHGLAFNNLRGDVYGGQAAAIRA